MTRYYSGLTDDLVEDTDEPDADDLDWYDESEELAEVLRDALHDDYADADPDDLDGALVEVLGSMSPAESFNFAKALQQIEKGAGRILSDPVVGQVARTALPVAGGALGTVVGGPVGTALGTRLGTAAASALPGRRPASPTAGPAVAPAAAVPGSAPAPAVAGGSAAAAQGLILSQKPEILTGLLRLAMGQHGQTSVDGVPVASIMNMLSAVFGQAAADADELMYLDQDRAAWDPEAVFDDAGAPTDRSTYALLIAAENDDLADLVGQL